MYNLNTLDHKHCQNKLIEFKLQRKSQSEHKQRLKNIQSHLQQTQKIDKSEIKYQQKLERIQQSQLNAKQNFKIQNQNQRFLKNLQQIMTQKNRKYYNEQQRELENDYLMAREEHTFIKRKNELKEISYQNLNILNRIRNAKSTINNEKMTEEHEKKLYLQNKLTRFNKHCNKKVGNAGKKTVSLPKTTDNRFRGKTNEQILLYQGNISIRRQIYRVKMFKNINNFMIQYKVKNNLEQFMQKKKEVIQTILIDDDEGYSLQQKNNYHYEKICALVIYKQLFQSGNGQDNARDSNQFDRMIKKEMKKNSRKHNLVQIHKTHEDSVDVRYENESVNSRGISQFNDKQADQRLVQDQKDVQNSNQEFSKIQDKGNIGNSRRMIKKKELSFQEDHSLYSPNLFNKQSLQMKISQEQENEESESDQEHQQQQNQEHLIQEQEDSIQEQEDSEQKHDDQQQQQSLEQHNHSQQIELQHKQTRHQVIEDDQQLNEQQIDVNQQNDHQQQDINQDYQINQQKQYQNEHQQIKQQQEYQQIQKQQEEQSESQKSQDQQDQQQSESQEQIIEQDKQMNSEEHKQSDSSKEEEIVIDDNQQSDKYSQQQYEQLNQQKYQEHDRQNEEDEDQNEQKDIEEEIKEEDQL